MDEPTDGLDPNQKHQVRKLIGEMAADKAIIVSTHILEEVEAVCSRAIIINRGRIVADGTAEDLMRRLPYHNAIALKRGGRPAPRRSPRRSPSLRPSPRSRRVGTANGRVQLRATAQRQRAAAAGACRPDPRAADRGRGGARRARQPRRRVPADHHLGHGDAPCMSFVRNTWIIAKREFVAYFSTPAGHGVPDHLHRADRRLRLLRRRLLRARPGRPRPVLPVPPLALPAAGAGGGHAAVGGGAQVRHHRAADDAADLAVGGDPRQVPRRLGVHRRGAAADAADVDHGQRAGQPRQRRDPRRATSAAS